MDLDLNDKKILFELDVDSRQSFSVIGKKTRLSKEVVTYRVNRLIKDGIIKNFYTRIDTSKLGKILFRTFLRTYNLTPEREKDLINYLINFKNVGWCVTVDGNWNINFIYWADSINDFSNFWKSFMGKYGEFVENKWISIFDKYTQYPKAFILNDSKYENLSEFICGGNEKLKLNEIDLKILKLLSENSRLQTINIAKKLKISTQTITQRIKKLKKEKIIIGFGITLDLNKIHYNYFKIHLNFKNFSQKRVESLIFFSKQHPNIIFTNEIIGGSDLELDVFAKDRLELQKIINYYKYNFNDIIKNIEILQYFEELKHNHFPN